jgi:hypothetical protein
MSSVEELNRELRLRNGQGTYLLTQCPGEKSEPTTW